VLELQHENEFAKFYVQANPERTQLILCVVTNRKMTSDDMLQALDMFVMDSQADGVDIMADASGEI
jgi:hypothetical protein